MRKPISLPLVMAFTNTDFTEIFGCIGVVISCPLNGTITPGTLSQTGFAPSIGIAPLIIFAGIVTGWLTANGTCPIVSMTPTINAERRMPSTTRLLCVCTTLIGYPSSLLKKYTQRHNQRSMRSSQYREDGQQHSRDQRRDKNTDSYTVARWLLFFHYILLLSKENTMRWLKITAGT